MSETQSYKTDRSVTFDNDELMAVAFALDARIIILNPKSTSGNDTDTVHRLFAAAVAARAKIEAVL